MLMHATRIRASITAYSTAVGPSSSVSRRSRTVMAAPGDRTGEGEATCDRHQTGTLRTLRHVGKIGALARRMMPRLVRFLPGAVGRSGKLSRPKNGLGAASPSYP